MMVPNSQQMLTGEKAQAVTQIQSIVRQHFRLRVGDLVGAGRTRDLSWPRQLAMALVRKHTLLSMPVIGRRFGGRDHTTVLHALLMVEDRCGADVACANDFEVLDWQVAIALGRAFIRHAAAHDVEFKTVRAKRGG